MSLTSDQQNNRLKKYAATASVALAITLTFIKSVAVLTTGSLSVLSSLIDSLADLFASSITFFAVRYSSAPADCSHRYGHGKAEALSALLQSAFIAGSGLFILYDGISRFFIPRTVTDITFGIGIMIISLILTIALIVFQKYVAARTHSKAISADSAHYSVDVITNLSIIITLCVVHVFNIYWFDTVIAFLISTYLLANAFKIANDALGMLLDKELSDDIRENITKIVLSCAHVQGMHDLRTRDLGGIYMFEFHLELNGNLSLLAAHQHTDNVENQLRKAFPNVQIIIHQDPAGLQEDRLDNKLDSCRP